MAKKGPLTVEFESMPLRVCGINLTPAIGKLFSWLPETTRKNVLIKQSAPSKDETPRDRYDCVGENPYNVDEIVEDRLWRVTYSFEDVGITTKKGKGEAKKFGMDPNDEKFKTKLLAGAEQHGEKAKEVAIKDLEIAKKLFNRDDLTLEEIFQIPPNKLNTYVVKLNNGSLLLYAPIKVRDESGFGPWLDKLGKVEWLVIASSFHTLFLPSVIKRYPDAKIIGPRAAEAKLLKCGVITEPFTFKSTNENGLISANEVLASEGVQLYNTAGDTCTHSLMALVDNTNLITCDLTYGHHDGLGFGNMTADIFNKFLEEDWPMRFFKFSMVDKPNSPNGFLPSYRFWFMDHLVHGPIMCNDDPPASDGSTPGLMAKSLRTAMSSLKYDQALGVHFNVMSRDFWNKTIDSNWNWLDGESLI